MPWPASHIIGAPNLQGLLRGRREEALTSMLAQYKFCHLEPTPGVSDLVSLGYGLSTGIFFKHFLSIKTCIFMLLLSIYTPGLTGEPVPNPQFIPVPSALAPSALDSAVAASSLHPGANSPPSSDMHLLWSRSESTLQPDLPEPLKSTENPWC